MNDTFATVREKAVMPTMPSDHTDNCERLLYDKQQRDSSTSQSGS